MVQKQTRQWFSGSGALNAATPFTLKTVKGATWTIYVTKITVSITTHANGKVITIEDSAGAPVVIAAHTDATAAAGVPSVVTWDFGSDGIPLTAGKNLVGTTEAAGPAGFIYAEGYEKQ